VVAADAVPVVVEVRCRGLAAMLTLDVDSAPVSVDVLVLPLLVLLVLLVPLLVLLPLDARAFRCCRLYLDRSLLVHRLFVAGSNENSSIIDDALGVTVVAVVVGIIVVVVGGGVVVVAFVAMPCLDSSIIGRAGEVVAVDRRDVVK
jgi:hypothetical protein